MIQIINKMRSGIIHQEKLLLVVEQLNYNKKTIKQVNKIYTCYHRELFEPLNNVPPDSIWMVQH